MAPGTVGRASFYDWLAFGVSSFGFDFLSGVSSFGFDFLSDRSGNRRVVLIGGLIFGGGIAQGPIHSFQGRNTHMCRDLIQLRPCVLWLGVLLGVSPVTLVSLCSETLARSASPASVTLQNNLLSVDVREHPLRTVIESIATQSNIEVRYLEEFPDARISIRFANVPLVDGLKRLFRAAALQGYVLVTDPRPEQTSVQRIVFLPSQPASGGRTGLTPRFQRRPPASSLASAREGRQPDPASLSPQMKTDDTDEKDSREDSVFEEFKTNQTARRLLSQLMHPNEQVRERALERLVRLFKDDDKQAELLDILEPLMDDLAAEEKTVYKEARKEIRKLLRR
ncbi:hypothetical protein NKDENANG_02475 [Candidatus Entotheonellaceae bacterium PAL068K]